jgi:hypothetical protein
MIFRQTLSRLQFMIAANAVWAGQFFIAFLIPEAPDYQFWRKMVFRPDYEIGCFEDAYHDSWADRLFILGLLWLVTTPVMNLIALRRPVRWPVRLESFWWNGSAPVKSALTLALAVAGGLWPLVAAVNAPVLSGQALEGVRTVMLFAVLLYYRGVALNE